MRVPSTSALVAALPAALVAAAGLCGCGGVTPASGRLANAGDRTDGRAAALPRVAMLGGGGVAPLAARAPASLREDALPAVGSTQRVDAGGARLAVTLRAVLDPLRDSGAELPARSRAVGVMIQIRSSGPKPYDSSATGDVRLVASSGVVAPVLATRGVCRTPLNDFDRDITSGEDRVGCVVFAVANGATLDAVWFSPHAHRPGRLTWAP